jgi:5-methylcytosine-specific restriction protein A
MPARPARRCTIPGCPNRPDPDRSRCAEHDRALDAARGSKAARGYDAAWTRIARSFVARHPTCVDWPAPGCQRRSTTADHDPVSRRQLVAAGVTDPDADRYLKPRCTPCHSRRTVAVDGGLGHEVRTAFPTSLEAE